jgi:hypothetical protein
MRLSAIAALGVTVCVGLSVTGCRNESLEASHRSEHDVQANIGQARDGLQRFTSGFVPLLESLAPSIRTSVAANNEANVRFDLMGLGTRQTSAGSLTMYSTGFVVAVRPDGTAIARDIAEADDRMREMQLNPLFPSVRAALAGTAGLGLGELPPTSDQPARTFVVAAAPVRNADNSVAGALAAGVSYGHLAHSIERAIRTQIGQRPVIWVGLHHGNRVFPSGADRDVPPAWLVPQSLINQVPADWQARLARGGGQFTWNFVENNVRGWGAALATMPQLDDTRVLIFRSEGALH